MRFPRPTRTRIPATVKPSAAAWPIRRADEIVVASSPASTPSQGEPGSEHFIEVTSALADVVQRLDRLQQQLSSIEVRLDAAQRPTRVRARLTREDLLGEQAIDVEVVAGLLGVSRSTVYRWVQRGDFIKQTNPFGGAARWQLAEVQAWIATHRPAANRPVITNPL